MRQEKPPSVFVPQSVLYRRPLRPSSIWAQSRAGYAFNLASAASDSRRRRVRLGDRCQHQVGYGLKESGTKLMWSISSAREGSGRAASASTQSPRLHCPFSSCEAIASASRGVHLSGGGYYGVAWQWPAEVE
jgi:hypothetical protein